MTTTLETRSENLFDDVSEDSIRPVGYIGEGFEDKPRTARWRTVIERYVTSECALNISLCKRPLRDTVEPASPEYGAILQWPTLSNVEGGPGDISVKRWKRRSIFTQLRHGKMDRAVLVGVREFMKMPKLALVALPCAAVVYWERLLGPDQADSVVSDPFEALVDATAVKSGQHLKNRKLNLAPRGRKPTGAVHVQFMCQVIEAGADVVNDLPDYDAPHWIWIASSHNAEHKLFRLAVELDRWNVRVAIDEDSEFGLKSVELAPSALALQPDTA